MAKKYIFLFVLFFCVSTLVRAQYQSLSENAEVSILTIGPGVQLYDSFGHSAFRIKDETSDIDIVYNYGVYDFNTPNFYTKFARGKLLYKLVAGYYTPFVENYIKQNRWIKEQTLNLSYSEKQNLFEFLENNRKPENQYYKYDFFFDNCATKIRDVLVAVLEESLVYSDAFIKEEFTFRELIQKNVYANSWGSLGMDVAIGAVVDRKATPWEYQFLPEYVFQAAANASLIKPNNKEPLVKETTTVFENAPINVKSGFFKRPIFVFGLIGLLLLFITYKDLKKNQRSRFVDIALFFITGVIGIFLLLLWFGTDHTTTANNYNLLWAFPFSLLVLFAIAKKQPKNWVRRYIIFLTLLLALLAMHWITGVQTFARTLLPLLIAMLVRYIYLIYYFKKNKYPNITAL